MHDVVIVGCGPAGSTAANLLRQAGKDVVVLEREHFPRFHIGESLLPIDLPLFDRLGVRLDGGAYHFKQGAEFWDERTGDFAFFSFADGLQGTPPHAWQVDRAAFDEMLARAAIARGAQVRFGATVTEIEVEDDGVRVVANGEELRARFVLDATGQDAFFARRARSVSPIRELGRAAVFTHFEGLAPEVRAEIEPQGNIKVLLVEDGWHWLIPLVGGRLSVGLVKWRGKLDEAALDADDRQLVVQKHAARRASLGVHRRRRGLPRPGVLVGRVAGDARRGAGGRSPGPGARRRDRERSAADGAVGGAHAAGLRRLRTAHSQVLPHADGPPPVLRRGARPGPAPRPHQRARRRRVAPRQPVPGDAAGVSPAAPGSGDLGRARGEPGVGRRMNV